jgi:hypothetical protein
MLPMASRKRQAAINAMPKAMPVAKRKPGRPLKPIDMDLVAKLAHIQCTDEEISSMVGMTPEGFCDRKKRDTALFECLENGRHEGRMSLRRVQWKAAQAGDRTMLVWLGKQYLGQRDQQGIEHTGLDAMTFQIVLPEGFPK